MKRQTQDIGQCSCEMGRSHLNFLSTPGNTYTLEFYLPRACFATAVNNFFEEDDVFIVYEEEVVVKKMNYSVSNQYRYGFNSMEKDDEVKGAGNHYDLGLRNYDPRLGRMFIIDPRANEYPWQTTYDYHRNSPIMTIDFLGGGDAIRDAIFNQNQPDNKPKVENSTGVAEKARENASEKMGGGKEYFEPHRSGDGDSTKVVISPKGDTTKWDNWGHRIRGSLDAWGKKVED